MAHGGWRRSLSGRVGVTIDTGRVEPPCPNARDALSAVFDRVEAAAVGRGVARRAERPAPAAPDGVRFGDWPLAGITMVTGERQAALAVAAAMVVAAASATEVEDDVIVQGTSADVTDLLEVALAQQGPPLDRIRSGRMAAGDWPPLSRAMGRLAARVSFTPTSGALGVWADGRGLLIVETDAEGTEAVVVTGGRLTVGDVSIGRWDPVSGRVTPPGAVPG